MTSPLLAKMIGTFTSEELRTAYWSYKYGPGPYLIFNNDKDSAGKDLPSLSGVGVGDRKRLVSSLAESPDLRMLVHVLDCALEIGKKLGLADAKHKVLKPVCLCSREGCAAQRVHCDFPDEVTNGQILPVLSLLVTIQPHATILLSKANGEMELKEYNVGQFPLFGSKYPHAGGPSSIDHYRAFAYIGTDTFKPPNSTDHGSTRVKMYLKENKAQH